MFLLRFPLIRELVYGSGDESKKNKPSQSKEPTLRRSTRLKEKKTHID